MTFPISPAAYDALLASDVLAVDIPGLLRRLTWFRGLPDMQPGIEDFEDHFPDSLGGTSRAVDPMHLIGLLLASTVSILLVMRAWSQVRRREDAQRAAVPAGPANAAQAKTPCRNQRPSPRQSR